MTAPSHQWTAALDAAIDLMDRSDLEPRSALKQCGSDHGIEYGEAMGAFVTWAESRMYGHSSGGTAT